MHGFLIVLLVILVILSIGCIFDFFRHRKKRYVISVCKKDGEIVGARSNYKNNVDSSSFPQKLKDAMVEDFTYTLCCKGRKQQGKFMYYFDGDNIVTFTPKRVQNFISYGTFVYDGKEKKGHILNYKSLVAFLAIPMVYASKYDERIGIELLPV